MLCCWALAETGTAMLLRREESFHTGVCCAAIILEENWGFYFLILYNWAWKVTTSGTPLCNIPREMSYFPSSETRRVFRHNAWLTLYIWKAL